MPLAQFFTSGNYQWREHDSSTPSDVPQHSMATQDQPRLLPMLERLNAGEKFVIKALRATRISDITNLHDCISDTCHYLRTAGLSWEETMSSGQGCSSFPMSRPTLKMSDRIRPGCKFSIHPGIELDDDKNLVRTGCGPQDS